MQGTDVEQEPAARCPECGQAHGGGAKFCSECGTRLAAEPERETRKTVTAVFADVIGSTPLQERIDAEAAHHVMDRFYHAMREVLEAHDGRVAKFIGDAVVAIFGVPAVREDDALRAVQAAGAMRDALAVLNDELERDWGVRIGMRVGVNTGEVVISPEGLAVGDAMNTAARLEQTAGDGEILIGESTYRHVRHAVQCQPVDALTLKGKREPVTAFLLVHAPARGGQQRARIEAPLVGRDPELARLVDVFDDAVRERTCRLVTVIGSPGLGKTRLAEELTTALADSATVVQGRCEPTGEGITFLPVAEVLRGAAGIGEADEPAVVRAKLAALLPGDPDAELLVERAGGVLGIAKPATAEETFWSVRRLLGGLARERPLVVVLDDVHWGQPTFLDLVEHLVEWARQAPILILALARPELRDLRPALTEPDGIAADVVELVPLADEHCRDLVRELLDQTDVPEALADRVLQTTGGNPLFLGETLRMFVDDGVLRREGDGWVATIDADAVEVPPTITALLAARIARLGADERSVVERAAVIGKQFYRGAVADLAPPLVAAGIDGHLRSLHRKEVVEPDGTTWIDEPVFRFHHVLIRDAAYRTLLKDARAELHERFADWLCEKAGALVGEHEEVIAFHLEQAYGYRRELGPLDERARMLGERAVVLLHATGRRALEREDLPAATNLLGRAAGVLADASPGAADVLIDLLEALLSAGQTDEVAAVTDRLRALGGHGERPRAWATIATAQLAQLTGATGLQDSLAEIASAGETLAAAGDDAGLAKAHHVRAQALALLGQVAEVEAALDQALAAARRGGDTRRATAVLSWAPRAALWGPSPVMRSSGRCLDVVRILRMTQGNRHVEPIALRCQAVLEAMRGRDEAGRQILDRCRMTLEELGLRLELLETEHYTGIVELVAGDHAAAEAHLRTAHDGFAQRGLDVGAAATAALLARALVEQGRDEEALELTRFSEERGRENLKTTIAWCGVRARVLAGRGEHEEAEALAGRAVALADGTDALVDHGDARLDLARVLRAAGQEERALAEARRAAELYEAKGHEAGAARAAAFAHEERRAPAPAVGADALPTGLPIGVDAMQRLCAAVNQRDAEALRAIATEDIVILDRRPASPRGDSHDVEGLVRATGALMDASDDLRSSYTHFVDAGKLAIVLLQYFGHTNDGGGAFTLPLLGIARTVGDRLSHGELFLPEDERAALDGLVKLHPDIDERVAWTSVFRAMLTFNERERDALAAPYAQAYADLPEGRMSVEIVATAGADAVMSRHWIDAEPPVEGLGQVVSLQDGVALGVELFDAHDTDAMRARFAALGGVIPQVETPGEGFNMRDWDAVRRALPKGLPAGRYGVLLQRVCAAISERDEDTLWASITDDVVVLDRRPASPRGDTHDAEGFMRSQRAFWAASDDVRCRYSQLVEAGTIGLGHEVYSGHSRDGGGAFVLPMLMLTSATGGRAERFEVFLPEDERAALDRLVELHPAADERVAWSSVLDAMFAFNERDPDALGAPFAKAYADLPEGHMSVDIVATAGTDAVMSRLWIDAEPPVEGLGQVVTLREGVAVDVELFDVSDGAGMRARFAALGGSTGPVGPMERFFEAHCAAFNARDWGTTGSLWGEDMTIVDRRRTRVWTELRGRAAVLATWRDMPSIATDMQVTYKILEGDDETAIFGYSFRGHAVDGGGELEFAVTGIAVLRADGVPCYCEFFDDDEDIATLRARREELAPLARRRMGTGLPDEPLPVEHWLLRLMTEVDRAGHTGRWDDLRALLAPDFVTIDNRRVRTFAEEPIGGREAFIDRAVSLAASSHALHRRYELLAASPTLTAVEVAAVGRMADGGGPFDLRYSAVSEWRDGVLQRVEFFDPEDEHVVLERFAELEAGVAANLGPGAVADVLTRISEAVNARDWTALDAELSPDFALIDRRPATGWVTLRGHAEIRAMFQSFVAAAPDLVTSFETLEGDDEVAIVHWTWRGHASKADGGGPFEDSFLMVYVVRDGLGLRNEAFSVDADLDELRAHAEKLRPLARRRPGTGLPDEPLPAERLSLALARALDDAGRSGYWDAFRALLAPGFHSVDHRTVPTMDAGDAETFITREASLAASAHDVRRPFETIAAGAVCAAIICRVVGTLLDGDGPFEVPIGALWEFRDGLAARIELFEPEDEAGALARFTELEAETGSDATLAVLMGIIDAANARDWDALGPWHAEDFLLFDRRPAGWSETRGRRAVVELHQSFHALSPDLHTWFELLDGDDEVAVLHWGHSGHALPDAGGGAFDDAVTFIVIIRDGTLAYGEHHPDAARTNLAPLLARAEELRPLARRRPGTGLPDEPLPVERLTGAFWGGVDEAGRTGEWEPVRARLAPEFCCVDHRTIPTMDTKDPETYIAHEVSLAAAVQDIRRRYEIIAAGALCCTGVGQGEGSLLDAGGRFELAVGFLLVFRDGLAVRLEFFEPEDEAVVLARFAELEESGSPEGAAGPAGRVLERCFDRINARDLYGVRDRMTEDYVMVDHRPASPMGDLDREGHLERIGSMFEVSADARIAILRHIAEIDGVWLGDFGWTGHYEEGGGAFEIPVRIVWTTRGGRGSGLDAFAIDDEAGALRAMMRRLGAADDAGPGTELGLRLADALAAHDWERAETCFAVDVELVDHRDLSTLGFDQSGVAGFMARVHALVAVAGDAQPEIEPLAELHGVAMAMIGWSGHLDEGGGAFAVRWRAVIVAGDGVVVRYELFDEDDEAGMLAALARLRPRLLADAHNVIARAGSDGTLDVLAGIRDAVNPRDWDAAGARYADDFLLVDRRLAAWSEIRGRQAMLEMYQSFTTLSPDVQQWCERLEGDDEVAVVRWGWGGHFPAADGGGAFEDSLVAILVVRDGTAAYVEHYPDEARTDLVPLRARAEELRPLARRRPGAGLPDEPLPAERWILQFVTEIDRAGQTGRWDDVRALMAPEFVTIDRRSVPTLGEVVADGREAFIERDMSLAASAHDVRRPYELLAATPTLTAISFVVMGRMADGGGEFEIAAGGLSHWRDGTTTFIEFFDADEENAMLARFAELEAERPAGAVERALAGVRDAYTARDWAALGAWFAEDILHVDRRLATGWTDIRGREAMIEHFRSFLGVMPDLRNDYDEFEGDDHVALAEWRWWGHAEQDSGGGPLADSMMIIFVARDGLVVHIELYPFDADRAPLRARAEELRPLAHRRPGLGLPDEPLPSERLFLTWARTIDRAGETGDWQPLRRILAPDIVADDHRRPSAWGTVEGIDAYVETEMSLAAAGRDVRRRTYEVLAADAGRLAGIGTVTGRLADGDGPFELQIGVVFEWRDDLLARIELFEPADEAAILERFASPVEAVLEDPEPPRSPGTVAPLLPGIYEAFQARDWVALGAAYAEESVQVDARPASGWEDLRGPAAMVAHFQSFLQVSPDLTASVEVVEADDEVAFGRWDWWGHATAADGGGPYEDGVTVVYAARDGRVVRAETHAADADLEFLRARAEALRPLALRRPGSGLPDEPLPTERLMLRFRDAIDDAGRTGRWEDFRALLSPGYQSVDHRAIPTMNMPDTEAYIAAEASLADGARGDLRRPYECFAAGAACCAVIASVEGSLSEGGGPFEIPVGVVFEFRDGLAVRFEVFEPDDEAGMLACLAELEAEAETDATLDALTGVRDAFAARDWDALGAQYDVDVLLVDRRPAAWSEIRGRQAQVELFRSFAALSSDVQAWFERLQGDDEVAVYRWGWGGHAAAADGGGAFEDILTSIAVVRDGVATYVEHYPDAAHTDLVPLRARAEELRPLARRRPGVELPDEPLPPERLAVAFARALDEAGRTGRWEDPKALLAPGFHSVDHRPVPTLNASNADAYIAAEASLADSVRGDLRRPYECFAAGATCVAVICRGQGTLLDGGGPFEIFIGVLLEYRDDLAARIEFFAPEDEEGMLARFAELEAEAGSDATLEMLAAARDAVNARDWDALGARFGVDFRIVDRRLAAWTETRGRQAAVELFQSFTAVASDLTVWFERLEGDDEVAVARWGWGGHFAAADGGGAFDDALTDIFVARDGVAVYVEQYPDSAHTDLAPLRARAEELRPLARRRPSVDLPDEPLPSERWFLRLVSELDRTSDTRRWDTVKGLLAPDCLTIDRRSVSPMGELHGRDAYIEREISIVASSHDLTRPYEVIAASSTLTAAIVVAEGRMLDGDGPFELPVGVLVQWRDGIALRIEFFDAEDEEALLARFAELEADRERCGVEEVLGRVRDTFDARDWAGLEDCFDPGLTMVDRRPLALWEDMHDAAAMVQMFRSFQREFPDTKDDFDLLEGDDEIGIVLWSWRGTASDEDGGGPWAEDAAMVHVVRDGRDLCIEVYAPDTDVETLHARAEELRPLARRRPGAELPEEPLPTERSALRLFAAVEAAGRTGDWAEVTTLLAPSAGIRDHRLASVFGDEVRDREALVDTQRSLAASGIDMTRRYEILAASDRLTLGIEATRGRLVDGDGPFELLIGILIEWAGDVAVRLELFAPEDEAAMLARFHEREPGREHGAVDEVLGRVRDTFNARDWAGLAGCFDPGFTMVDRRPLALWDQHDAAAMIALFRSFQREFPDPTPGRRRVVELIEGDNEVGIARWLWRGMARDEDGGGPFAEDVTMVHVMRDGRALLAEVFTSDADVEALRARAEKLRPLARGAELEAGGADNAFATAPAGVRDAFNARDWAALQACYDDEFVFVNHRPASGWEDIRGPRAMVETFQTFDALIPDCQASFELIDGDDEVAIYQWSYGGHATTADGGGPLEDGYLMVSVVRAERPVRVEAYPDDTDIDVLRQRAEALQPLARRRRGADLPDEPLDAERWTVRYWAELDEAGRTGRSETFRELLAPDFCGVDHRLASMSAINDRETYIAFEMSLATSSRDLRRSYELIAASNTATGMIATARGNMADGGGPFELHLGLVLGWRDGVAVRLEAFDPEDEDALLARFRELT